MARPRNNLTSGPVDPAVMSNARKLAEAKKARLIAEAELGIGDEGAAVVKGLVPIENEEQVTLTLDMYPGAEELRIDNRVYRHGQTITIGKRQADSIREMIARGWRHQEEIEGKVRNTYKPHLNIISGKHLPAA